ncbi:hypothetical protein PhCBS80983_g04891 [Powellomyces hirtus]|uniref:Uncharacterized protein n=1 Tax=Powellomyces hirtus TaxID=109895 RepID=A0A507DXS1_9FUNG|nr:hypothetical protein PhCBS80983_g04891 [Powellomyces hirtus]
MAAPSTTNVTETVSDTSSSYDYHGGKAPPKATDVVVEPIQVTKEINEPVVHETINREEREEIQPVIERERIQTEIQQVVQPVLDVVTEAPVVEKVELEHESHKYREKAKEEDVKKYEQQAEAIKDETTVEEVHEKVYLEPIIHETVKKRVITEIQPVIERVVHQTHVVEETQHINETFVKAPVVHDTQVATPMSIDEFNKLSGGTASVVPTTIPATTTGSASPGPMTRLKRKKLAEAADGPNASSVTSATDDGSVEVHYPSAHDVVEPSKIRGTLEKLVGVVESSVGELIGSDGLVAAGEARKAEGDLEIQAASAKKRKVDV